MALNAARRFTQYQPEMRDDMAQEALVAAWRRLDPSKTKEAFYQKVMGERMVELTRGESPLGSERAFKTKKLPDRTSLDALIDGDVSGFTHDSFIPAALDEYPSDRSLQWFADLLPDDGDLGIVLDIAIGRPLGTSSDTRRASRWKRLRPQLADALRRKEAA